MKRHLSLITRFSILLILFLMLLMLQIGISKFQHSEIIEPMENSIENVQSLSVFLNNIEMIISKLEAYRWDYGDVADLIAAVRVNFFYARNAFDSFEVGPNATRTQHTLADAVEATFMYYNDTMQDLYDCLFDNKPQDAASLYYEDIEPCGKYLRQYIQELIELNIIDSREIQQKMMERNRKLNIFLNSTELLSVVGVASLFIYMLYIISNIMDMDMAARKLKSGHFDIEDLKVKTDDEVGNLVRTFNEMKVSLKRQVELLEEKREMEAALFRKDREALELQTLVEQEKLQQLRNQINPHFLFNTLNVVKLKSNEENAPETEALLSSLARLFRYVLQSNDNECPLSREIHIVNEFYALTRARFGEKVNLVWDFSPDVDLTETLVPSFLLEPLVENAFKHGIQPKEGNGTVRVSICEAEGRLRITIEDDGVGMSREVLDRLNSNMVDFNSKSEHIGVYNVASRLRLLSPDTEFHIESEEGRGTHITLVLPLKMEWEDEKEEDDDQDTYCR